MSAHPISANLRELADWLDEHPEVDLGVTGFYAWLKTETPESFSAAVKAIGVEPNLSETYSVTIKRNFGSVLFHLSALKEKIGKKRIVLREVEEFVIGDAS